MSWRAERICTQCAAAFQPKREAQRHCSTRCRNVAKVRRHRHKKSGYTPEKRLQAMAANKKRLRLPTEQRRRPESSLRPTVADNPPPVRYGWDLSDLPLTPNPLDGALVLSGDDYPTETDADGITPILPACLRRRKAT